MKKNVVLLHGAFSSPLSFQRIKEKIPDANLIFPQYSVEESLESVVHRVNETVRAVQGPVELIGHSLGGVICMAVARINPLVQSVFTMASPFGGNKVVSHLKWVNKHEMYRTLDPTNETLTMIRNEAPTCRICSVITTLGNNPLIPEANDGVVSIKSQSALSYGSKIHMPVNHFEVLMADKIIDLIKEFTFNEA